jgi:ArsR family metal-binding transcriptional regulator
MLINGYSNLSITNPPCHPGAAVYCAQFKLDADVSHLFPYINAEIADAQYYEKPECILFNMAEFKISLYPDHANAAAFMDREQALSTIGKLINFLNDLDHRKDSLVPNHNRFKQPRTVLEVFKALPRTNCKKCGYPTCMAFAAAVTQNEALTGQCPDFQAD